jgi:hypothetical protein
MRRRAPAEESSTARKGLRSPVDRMLTWIQKREKEDPERTTRVVITRMGRSNFNGQVRLGGAAVPYQTRIT